jgi:hypothetical protein
MGGNQHKELTMKDEQDREEHMSKMEAVGILLKLAYKRTTTRDEVLAIQTACKSTLKRFFDRERNWKRRHEAEIAVETVETVEEVAQ